MGTRTPSSLIPTRARQGNISVQLSAPDRSYLNCTLFQGYFATLEPSHVRFKEVYATILFAMAMNKRLIGRIVEGSSNCSSSYVRAFLLDQRSDCHETFTPGSRCQTHQTRCCCDHGNALGEGIQALSSQTKEGSSTGFYRFLLGRIPMAKQEWIARLVRKVGLPVVALCTATSAMAAANTHISGRLVKLQIGLSAGIYVYIDASLGALNCPAGVDGYVILDPTHARYKEIYSALVVAKSTGQEVTLRIVEGPTSPCKLMYVTLN
jgi:hypothetical protein